MTDHSYMMMRYRAAGSGAELLIGATPSETLWEKGGNSILRKSKTKGAKTKEEEGKTPVGFELGVQKAKEVKYLKEMSKDAHLYVQSDTI